MDKKVSLSERKVELREKVSLPTVKAFSPDECYTHFQKSITLLKKQFDLADTLLEKGDQEDFKQICRSQIVFLEGILDFYIHELTKIGIKCMFLEQWPKTQKYMNLCIPMSVVEKGVIETSTSCEWLLEHCVGRIGLDTYLSYKCLKDQLNFLGISLDAILSETFYSTCEFTGEKRNDGLKNGKKWINDLFMRRNQIAHQMDRSLCDSSEYDISKEFVSENIKNVELFISKIHEKAIALLRSPSKK